MDVQCERCKTEYEFDDALVSGKGTTVKCTNCGLQFKVRGAQSAEKDDRWLVTTTSGRQLVFHSLKDLQRAIFAQQVSREDRLTRGNGQPRSLGSIAELVPFFDERKRPSTMPPATAARPPQPRRPTPLGIGAVRPSLGMNATKKTASPSDRPATADAPVRPRMNTISGAPPPPPPPSTTIMGVNPPLAAAAPVPVFAIGDPDEHDAETRRVAIAAPPTAARRETVPGMQAAPVSTPPVLDDPPAPPRKRGPSILETETSSPLPPPTDPVKRSPLRDRDRGRDSAPAYDEVEARMREAMDDEPASDELPNGGRMGRRRVGGWLVAVALLVGVSVLGLAVIRPYMAARQGNLSTTASGSTLDPRVQAFLKTGEVALGDGDYETAMSNFDKASVLAEKEPHVLVDVALLNAARADIFWLELKLLPVSSPRVAAVSRQLDEFSKKARASADLAASVAPEDLDAVRAKIDALRISGERDVARSMVARLVPSATQPESAYVLAALDLAEPDPLWKTVIERLRIATVAEGNIGRARAALTYALAKSGDTAGAKTEFEKLSSSPRPNPLVDAMRAFLGQPATAPLLLDASAPEGKTPTAPTVQTNAVTLQPGPGPSPRSMPTPMPPVGDSKTLVRQASDAYQKGDLDKAQRLYSAALDQDPNASEALGGLGDIARARGDATGARQSYKRALAANSHYMPAILGLADLEWNNGDKAVAQKMYKDIVDNYPEGLYPTIAKTRADVGAPAPPAAAAPDADGGGAP